MAEVETSKEARQGPKGKPVLYVLIGSLVLLAIYMVGLMTWTTTTSPPDHAGKSQESSRQQTTGSTGSNPSSNSTGTPIDNPAYPQPSQQKAQ